MWWPLVVLVLPCLLALDIMMKSPPRQEDRRQLNAEEETAK
jgi:hypothetical protein